MLKAGFTITAVAVDADYGANAAPARCATSREERTLGRLPGGALRRESTIRAKHSARADPTKRSANAFKFGLRAGRRTSFTLSLPKTLKVRIY